jgi:hypothetical protein
LNDTCLNESILLGFIVVVVVVGVVVVVEVVVVVGVVVLVIVVGVVVVVDVVVVVGVVVVVEVVDVVVVVVVDDVDVDVVSWTTKSGEIVIDPHLLKANPMDPKMKLAFQIFFSSSVPPVTQSKKRLKTLMLNCKNDSPCS